MSVSVRRTLAAGLATALALAALFPVFDSRGWLWRVAGAVGVVTAAGLVGRLARLPRTLQPVLGVVALGYYLAVVFTGATLHLGLPTQHTVDAIQALVRQGRLDLSSYGPPVPSTRGLVLLTAAGAGAVAVLVDVVAAGYDRVALAGLPLFALFAVPSAVRPGGLGSVPFAIAACGWLVLLIEEGTDRMSRWGAPLRSALPGARPGGDDPGNARVGRRVGVAALGVAIAVPALVPGLNHRLAGGNGNGDGPGSGGPSTATTYNPLTRLRTELIRPRPERLFVYSTDDPAPDYLRMTTLDTYTSEGWSSSRLTADRERARVQNGIARPDRQTDTTIALTTRIAVDGDHLDVHWLPVPFGPRQVQVTGTWLWDATTETVFSASRTTRRLPTYTVTAQRVAPTRNELETADPGVPSDIVQHYSADLPVSPYVQDLVAGLIKGRTTMFDRAVAIQQYFTPANGFAYDLNPSQAHAGQDPLDGFLEGRHGFCEQYATAMAVMLRVAGLPSRVAVGFTAGQPIAGRSGAYSVSTSDAHAWPEAWFDGAGWVRFEPTPGAAAATTPDYTLAAKPVPTSSSRPVPSASSSPSASRAKTFDPDLLLKGTAQAAQGHRPAGAVPGWLLAALGVVLLGALPRAMTALRRRARSRRGGAEAAWAQLRDDVLDSGRTWDPALSPRSTQSRLAHAVGPQARDALQRVASAVETARYAPPGRSGSPSLGAPSLDTDLSAVRRALLSSVSMRTRVRAWVLTPSTLEWAAHALSERTADVLDGLDRLMSVAGRPLRRRVGRAAS